MPLSKLSPILNETILTAETFNFLKIAVSTINEWENANMTARMVICLKVSVKDAIAPSAAYRFNELPRTSTIAASPGKPNKNMSGLNNTEMKSIIGVIPIKVTIK